MLTTQFTTRYERLRRNETGFTLGELLVGVVIIALLAAIALPIFINQQRAAVDASVKSDVRNTVPSVSQWVAAHPGLAVANTKVYLDTPNDGKLVKSSDHTVIGVFIKATGEYTVCGFNDGGGKYEKAEHAWGFQSSTGNFARVLSASCEGAVDADGHDISTTPKDPTFLGSDTLPAATQGDQYSTVIATSANPTPAFTLKSGSNLPLGLTLTQQGTLAGTPQATGDFEFTIVAKNFTGQSERKYKLTVGQASTVPTWGSTNVSLPDANQNSPYTTTLHANSYPDATYKVTVGDLPDGLTLNRTTGVLSGTPTKSGTAIFTVSAENSKAKSPLTFFLTVIADTTPPVWTTDVNLPDGRENSAYTATLHADGTPAPTYSFGSGNLPQGLTVNVDTGVLSGTPTESGTFLFTVNATNTNSVTPLTFFLTIAPDTTAPAWTTDVSLPDGRENTNYTITLNADGKPAPTYAVADGSSLPAGLSLNKTSGVLSGKPTDPGSFIFTVNATNSNSTTPITFFLKIASETIAPAWTTDAHLPNARQNSSYSATVHATGKPAPTYAVATGSSLPAGLSLSKATGEISGTPTDDGSFIFTINAVNADSTTPLSFFLTVAPDTTPPVWTSNISLPDGRENSSYSTTVKATGKPTPSYAVASGSSLPDGLSLNASTGAITGTPSVSGNFIFTLNAKNADSTTAQTFFLKLVPDTTPPVWTSNVNLVDGRENSSYSATVNATGKPQPTYAVASGSSLPDGLSLNATTGAISGTPTVYGNFIFTINAKNADSTTPLTFFLTIARDTTAPVWTSNASLTDGRENSSYSATVNATGKPAPTYAIASSSSLPAGLKLSASGDISGTPTAYGNFVFTINAVNANSTVGQAFFLTIVRDTTPPVWTSNANLTNGRQNSAYSATLNATGKPTPTYAVAAGSSLPDGLLLDPTSGVLSGTPTGFGDFVFTINATNANSTVAQGFFLTLRADTTPPVITTSSLPSGQVGEDYSGQVAATGKPAPTFTNISGFPGISIAADGTLSGTPTQSGTYDVTVTASNADSDTNKTLSVTVADAPSISIDTTVLPTGARKTFAYDSGNLAVTTARTTGTTRFSMTGLPAGLNYDTSTGRISGTPTVSGSFPIVATATNGNASDSQNYTLAVANYVAMALETSNPVAISIGGSFNASISASGTPTPTITMVSADASWIRVGASNAGIVRVTGTPIVSGTYHVTLQATNGIDAPISKTYTLTVRNNVTVYNKSGTGLSDGAGFTNSVYDSTRSAMRMSGNGVQFYYNGYVPGGNYTVTFTVLPGPTLSGTSNTILNGPNGETGTARSYSQGQTTTTTSYSVSFSPQGTNVPVTFNGFYVSTLSNSGGSYTYAGTISAVTVTRN